MRTLDLSPLHRFTVGFDNMSRLLDSAARLDEGASAYPPYNIEKHGEDAYRVTLAVAGFRDEDLEVTVHDGTLIVKGRQEQATDGQSRSFLHQGIATRTFERRFQLADHIQVTGATLADGLLNVDLVREIPEEKKPRRIGISTGSNGAKALPHDKADASKAA